MGMMEIRRRLVSAMRMRNLHFSASDFEYGSWGYSSKVSNSRRLRAKLLYAVKAGDKVVFTNPSFKFYTGLLLSQDDYSYHGRASGWIAAGQVDREYGITVDGYVTLILETPDGSAADLADYDLTITIVRGN